MIFATLFRNPMEISSSCILWLLIPLCVSVAIIYKTVRTDNVRRLHIQIVSLVAYMIAGLVLLGGVLWGSYEYWPF